MSFCLGEHGTRGLGGGIAGKRLLLVQATEKVQAAFEEPRLFDHAVVTGNKGADKPAAQACGVEDDREGHDDQGAGKAGHKHVEVAEVLYAGPPNHGNEGRGSSRRMEGAGQHHEHNGRCHCTGSREGHVRREGVGKEHAHKCRERVAAYDVAGTCKRTHGRAKDQHCRGPEGGYDERQAHGAAKCPVEQSYGAERQGAAKPDLEQDGKSCSFKSWKDMGEKRLFQIHE